MIVELFSEPALLVFLFCLFLGAIIGVLAGLLGIGGGLLVVPALCILLPEVGVATEVVMPLALGTSLASIVLTSSAAARNHLKAGNVDLQAVKLLLPGMLVGGLLGSTLADWIPTELLPKVFAFIVLFLALQMMLTVRVEATRPLPGWGGGFAAGSVIGTISTLAGIGGGSLTVPYLNRHSTEMRLAIGCSATTGAAIAIAGMLGFIGHGVGSEGLPDYSLGYVYLPAWAGIVMTSTFTSRFGVKLVSRWPTQRLKRFFALFLLVVSIRMFLG
ncbi:sulfite exporter TauE/SafE family protein [Thaumasiovibrio subtropicus]|uniref:sulfite exporter TauE/SafE family protein n=1 Tax=Thaumasiovibrio subtropicus TaxID=1891207 RepID=UPI000B34DC0B|nr:sulfite exporter TauE/SafE family protein [Thaumasiovibrio subtropicus]